MVVLLRGAKESAVANTVMVAVKIAALVLFCAVAFTAFRAGVFQPLLPGMTRPARGVAGPHVAWGSRVRRDGSGARHDGARSRH
ncbi:hypothetical protein [Streptomyces flaveolus]|uniref:hypothetical protein n=1 Tax=Streptomyces flaveolus TaxID=67297 RepID=UPI003F540B13